MLQVYPCSFSDVGLSVMDLEAGVRFYTHVMGWRLISPTALAQEQGVREPSVAPDCRPWRVAHLSTANQSVIQLFEREPSSSLQKPLPGGGRGISHVCVQVSDVGRLAEKIVAGGGRLRLMVRDPLSGQSSYRTAYMEDPFGNIVEVHHQIDGSRARVGL